MPLLLHVYIYIYIYSYATETLDWNYSFLSLFIPDMFNHSMQIWFEEIFWSYSITGEMLFSVSHM